MSPTRTSPAQLTSAGVLLGTAAYMAPEQARGRRADKRADIWAFGVVLYEMVTGARAFEGDTVTETLGAVIHKDPDWTKVPAALPADARVVLRRCLQKDPAERLRDMGDARLALDGAFTTDARVVVSPRLPRWKRATALASAVVLAAIAGGAAVWLYSRPEPSVATVRYPIRIDISLAGTASAFVAMAPNGRSLAFLSQGQHYIYSLEAATSRLLGSRGSQPFWSHDSESVAFAARGMLMRTDAAGSGLTRRSARSRGSAEGHGPLAT